MFCLVLSQVSKGQSASHIYPVDRNTESFDLRPMHFLRLVGCGTGVPISQVLIERGFKVYGVDAPPAIVVVAWGFFFLLDAEVQRGLIKKIGGVLQSGSSSSGCLSAGKAL